MWPGCAPEPVTLQEELRGLEAGAAAPELGVVLDDVHPLWGGERFVLEGGSCRREEWSAGCLASAATEAALAPEQVREVAAVLLEIRAWEQPREERAPVPDESRAVLEVRCGAAFARTWEWSPDRECGGRLARVRHRLRAFFA